MNWKIIVGIVAAGAVGFAATRAFASSTPDPSKDERDPEAPKGVDRKIRHGIAYEGCAHFELVSAEDIEAWVKSNPLKAATWLPKLAGAKEDPEPLLVELMGELFPECTWPPPSATTFGPERKPWSEALAEVKATLAAQDQSAARSGPSLDALKVAVAAGFGGAR